ncbi:MAG: DAK2 domain-containing protein, partial [Oscillospiraceae bacterium]|nr:DAK2 domain-containing protein [Oscillospiraceae bacterium]
MREIIDGAAFRDMLLCASDALEKHKQPINELNVFPVPDGDTGTNMSLTMRSGADALRSKKLEGVTAVADCAASALLRGARGNSGVILSLLFRGISKAVKGMNELTAHSLADAMQEGVDAAYKAVMKPAEGTILTVSRVAAKAAMDFAEQGSDVELLLVCALEAAKDALELTVEQNPVLKRAGVVDAGGKGYVVILDAMLASLQGRMFSDYEEEKLPDPAALNEGAEFGAFSSEDIEFAYDTVFIVRRTKDKPLEEFREYLVSIGDSLVIGEDDECFKVHVHTNEPGAAITEAQKYGTLEIAKIENMRSQSEDLAAGRKATSADALEEEEAPVKPEKRYGFVTVCAGEGMETLFRELGADGVVTGGQTMNPSTED